MSEIKYLDLDGLKYFKNKLQSDNKQYISKTGEIFEESTYSNTFVLTTDYIDGAGTIKGLDLSTQAVPMAVEADHATNATNAENATKADLAKRATNADNANNATTAESLVNSVQIYGQDFQGIDNVDSALKITNTSQVSLTGNLYGCNTPFSINSTIGHVGVKMTTNNNGYGSYTDGTTLYMWHQSGDPITPKQLYSITKNSDGYVAFWGFQKLNAAGTDVVCKSLTTASVNATGNFKIGSNQEVDIYYDGDKLVINKPLGNPTTDDHETRIKALEKTWVGTQSQYDKITIKDGDTFYYITEN